MPRGCAYVDLGNVRLDRDLHGNLSGAPLSSVDHPKIQAQRLTPVTATVSAPGLINDLDRPDRRAFLGEGSPIGSALVRRKHDECPGRTR